MARKIYDKLLSDGVRRGQIPGRTKQARDWYRNKARTTKATASDIIRSKQLDRKRANVELGDMVFFRYDAKGKKTLPYWDAFPLIFPISEKGPHFSGINMHLIPPRARAILMDNLYALASDKNYDQETKLYMTYNLLSKAAKYRWFKPAYRTYLKSRVKTNFIKVHSSEWDIALFLDVGDYRNASKKKVFEEYKKKMRG